MNCKQGDIAIIVRSTAGNEGRIVRVGSFIGKIKGWVGDDRWEIDIPLLSNAGCLHSHFCDSAMRPIRDPGEDATDETLEWLSVPSAHNLKEAA